ncbi:hypothetical protein [Lacibacter sp. H407]|uniref:hypothetical protein n=1 Tax=Lacibacter sp. H407 TaxID=3133423 RepID=UPI0030BFB969
MIVVNTQYVDFSTSNQHQEISAGFKGHFYIVSSLDQIGIREDEEIVIAIPVKNDLTFSASGFVAKVGAVDRIPPSARPSDGQLQPKEKYRHSYQIAITNDLTQNNLLSDLEYSIKAVYRFNKPIIHFQQQFRDLSKEDYETIIKGWVYASRTAFGKLVNSIPRQNKLEFMLQAMDFFATVDFAKVSLHDGLSFLYEYINRRILSRGRLIVETNELIKSELKEIVPYTEVGFYNSQKEIADNILTQATLFEKLFSLEGKSNINRIIQKSISEDSNMEQRFLQLFKTETWPIDLSL